MTYIVYECENLKVRKNKKPEFEEEGCRRRGDVGILSQGDCVDSLVF